RRRSLVSCLTGLPIGSRAATAEPDVKELLGLGPDHAVAALLPIGKPVKQLTKLRRRAVEDFVVVDRADGEPFTG
ncbi:MAG: hypothetical protein AAFN30_04810, partial [Actinomycetota bacterium]